MKDKKKMVVWLVSHCLTNNNRMAYAHELSKYIQMFYDTIFEKIFSQEFYAFCEKCRLTRYLSEVDIFGACGIRSLGKKESHQMIRDHYKFYLAFENSNCHQYITEKFWINALRNNAIPIVMGAPKIDYVKVAPPHSFIHVDDYSPRQLARFLSYLDQNTTAYNEYFEWKSFGRVVESDFYCRLCDLVQSPPTKTYANLDVWWKGNGDCQKYSKE
ncbi:fucosyl transferase [Dictyocaulus viviparus]|uniref:Fucosyltransferase n=1 Tax=Dictyocaulus viviparus TaxID=29172 RepID=A0A0D8XF94_DICVI|nr:fucosyl transferase [Dictyocaulus viviparus]